MTNNADTDQLASSEANWSGSTLLAKEGHIWVQQDQGYLGMCNNMLQDRKTLICTKCKDPIQICSYIFFLPNLGSKNQT